MEVLRIGSTNPAGQARPVKGPSTKEGGVFTWEVKQRLSWILDGAAVGPRGRVADGLAGGGLLQGRGDVILRAVYVGQIGRRAVVDRAVVDQRALGIDDEHVRGSFCVIKMSDGAGGIEKNGGGCGLDFL